MFHKQQLGFLDWLSGYEYEPDRHREWELLWQPAAVAPGWRWSHTITNTNKDSSAVHIYASGKAMEVEQWLKEHASKRGKENMVQETTLSVIDMISLLCFSGQVHDGARRGVRHPHQQIQQSAWKT